MKLEFILLALGAFVLACLSGPLFHLRPKPSDDIIAAVNGASDLDAYLREEESRVPDLKKDLAKGIVWADTFSQKKTPFSIVYLHGFSASRKDLSPVVERVASRIHANVFFSRLKAHGLEDGEGFANVTAQDWVDDSREALAIGKRIGEQVIVIGTSTGALLATMLVTPQNRDSIAGLILVSPNFGLQDWRAPFASGLLGLWLVRWFEGPYHIFPVENVNNGHIWTHRYRSEGIVALNDLVNYGKDLRLFSLGVPTLMLYTSKDKVVDVAAIQKKFGEIQDIRKQLIDMPLATRHELAGDALLPENNDTAIKEMVGFLKTNALGSYANQVQ
jgi:alpha-beta hydrolase superfamily lysophospholipase